MSTDIIDPKGVEKLGELIKDIGVGMIATLSPEGYLRSRPMACPKRGFDGDLWFFTSDDSPKIWEIAEQAQVNVVFSEPKLERYVSISGQASIVRNAAKAREMWNPLMKSWFPRGLDDPHLALLHVTVEHAEYWDAKASRMLVLLSLAKAAVTGGAPKHLGEHEKLA